MTAVRSELERALRFRFVGCRLAPLAGDASTRRFYRLTGAPGPNRIVMDYGAAFEDETDDVRLSRVFEAAGLRVAAIESVLPDPGCLVLEDLGDRTLESALTGASPEEREALYIAATEYAVRIAREGTRALERSPRSEGPALDEARFRFEMEFFLEHYVGAFLGQGGADPATRRSLHRLASIAAEGPRVLCHRDYHSRNLMVLADRSLAAVDIQDARWGPDSYDLASLLYDAYVDVDAPLVERMIERYVRAAGPAGGGAPFRARFAHVAAERMIKALGTFGYQIATLGRERYRDAIPRTVSRLTNLLPSVPDLADVAEALIGGEVL